MNGLAGRWNDMVPSGKVAAVAGLVILSPLLLLIAVCFVPVMCAGAAWYLIFGD